MSKIKIIGKAKSRIREIKEDSEESKNLEKSSVRETDFNPDGETSETIVEAPISFSQRTQRQGIERLETTTENVNVNLTGDKDTERAFSYVTATSQTSKVDRVYTTAENLQSRALKKQNVGRDFVTPQQRDLLPEDSAMKVESKMRQTEDEERYAAERIKEGRRERRRYPWEA